MINNSTVPYQNPSKCNPHWPTISGFRFFPPDNHRPKGVPLIISWLAFVAPSWLERVLGFRCCGYVRTNVYSIQIFPIRTRTQDTWQHATRKATHPYPGPFLCRMYVMETAKQTPGRTRGHERVWWLINRKWETGESVLNFATKNEIAYVESWLWVWVSIKHWISGFGIFWNKVFRALGRFHVATNFIDEENPND